MEDKTLKDFLKELGNRTPTPGGGAVAAVNGALASAQLKMVCEYSKDEELSQKTEFLSEKTDRFLRLAEEDGQAFQKVSEAYKTKDRLTINDSLLTALKPSIKIVAENEELIVFCEKYYEKFNKRLLADLVVVLSNVQVSLVSAQAMEKTNAKALGDTQPEELSADIKHCDELLTRLEKLLKRTRVL